MAAVEEMVAAAKGVACPPFSPIAWARKADAFGRTTAFHQERRWQRRLGRLSLEARLGGAFYNYDGDDYIKLHLKGDADSALDRLWQKKKSELRQ